MAKVKKDESTDMVKSDSPDAGGMVTSANDMSAAELAKEGFACEHYIPFKQGMQITGIFLGPGGDMETMDPKSGEIRIRKSWRIAHESNKNLVAILGGAAQLDSRLGGTKVGSKVVIKHRGQIDIDGGSKRANQYEFWTREA